MPYASVKVKKCKFEGGTYRVGLTLFSLELEKKWLGYNEQDAFSGSRL